MLRRLEDTFENLQHQLRQQGTNMEYDVDLSEVRIQLRTGAFIIIKAESLSNCGENTLPEEPIVMQQLKFYLEKP